MPVIQPSRLPNPKVTLVSATYGSDEDERRGIVDFITNCVEEVAGQGRVSNVTEIMTMCASFASDPPITMTTNTHDEESTGPA